MRNVYSGYHPLLFFASKCGYLSSFKRYGFRKPPYIELKARPKLGEREVTLVHVTDWIEKKLEQEFQVHLLGHLVFHAESKSSGQNRGPGSSLENLIIAVNPHLGKGHM